VVASAGARGRTLKGSNGEYTGKAPAAIVDLKAAVRYLKFNDKLMPGDANKIISNGTSAGGAMSALVGATGNNPDYEPYLQILGAANGTDDVFAVSAYCPITNLDHADMAYEWQFSGYNTYKGVVMQSKNSDAPSMLSEEQIKVSEQLKTLFPTYVNSLKLKDTKGNY
jgi:acetyl esterase/lipase